MSNRTTEQLDFGRQERRYLQANFEGGDLSSDGGLCCGYEDLNDHDTLRDDLLMKTAVGRDRALASAPTLCRLETGATRADAWALHEVLIEQFIAAFAKAPRELVLDVDASDVSLHGGQELRQFHAYYDHHCYLPLYVFCGQSMLACLLRPSRIDGVRHAAAVLRLLVGRLRQSWPDTRIIIRGDPGFCRQRLLRWCKRAGVHHWPGAQCASAGPRGAGRGRALAGLCEHGPQTALHQ